jgi:hypothetical protein
MILFLIVIVMIVATIILTYSHVKTLSLKIDSLKIQIDALEKKLEEKTIN